MRRSPVGGVLAVATLALVGCGGTERPPDVVLVSIDTLRADALSCYGNSGATSPRLDALAADGLRFDNAYVTSPNTAPSHATLFTGLGPWTHRVGNISSPEYGTMSLADEFTTLAEHFTEAGYLTAAVTDGDPLGPGWNLLQGFEVQVPVYDDVATSVDTVLELLDDSARERPLFLFFHTYQVHAPYLPPVAEAERFLDPAYDGHVRQVYERSHATVLSGGPTSYDIHRRMLSALADFTSADVEALRALYLAEVAYTDRELGRLFEALPPEVLVAVTADHGEEFGEHGVFEHRQLYEETLHVPLILRLPERALAGRAVDERVTLIDLHRTLLAAAGLEPVSAVAGVDLVALAREGFASTAPTVSLTTEHLDPLVGSALPWLRSVRTADGTLIERVDANGTTRSVELYAADDRRQLDPLLERTDAPLGTLLGAGRADALARTIRGRLEADADQRTRLLGDPRLRMRKIGSAEAVQKLKDLGYVDTDD